jgi:hypothetical protein
MSIRVTVDLPEDLARRAGEEAAQTQRRIDEVLLDWLQRAGTEPPVESLSNEQVLALCDSMLEASQQQELSELLDGNREGQLPPQGERRLDALMRGYRQGLVRKAQALRVAVARGLRPRLN